MAQPDAPLPGLESTGATASSATPIVDAASLQLHLQSSLRNDVATVGPHHAQTKSRQLSSTEKFFVSVAEVYQHQTLEKHAKQSSEQLAKTDSAAAAAAVAASSVIPTTWPFSAMENALYRARYQVDNIVLTIDQLLKGAGQRGLVLPSGASIHNANAPPVLTLAERNTEVYLQKINEQHANAKEQAALEKADAAAAAAAAAGGTDDSSMLDSATAGESKATDDELLAEFLRDGEDDDDLVSMVSDPLEAAMPGGGVSLQTRRNRLGTLLIMKRRQYARATNIFADAAKDMRTRIESERRFLEGVGQIARYWTVRTVPNTDAAGSVPPPSTSSRSGAQQQAQPQPLANPFQPGLPAGSTTPYPSLMVDYRLGTLDIHLDRGKVWMWRNDRGEIFVEDSVGRDSGKTKDATTTTAAGDQEMKDEATASTAADSSTPIPSWLTVSNRLHRAQHQLLYKHLYNAMMTEARELRIAQHKEQLKAAAHATNHARSAAAVPSGSTPASAASAAPSPFHPPPSSHTPRPWSVVEITPRRIVVQLASFAEPCLSLEWEQGVAEGFTIRMSAQQSQPQQEKDDAPAAAFPAHQSRLLSNQALCILLDHTLKNSLGNRKLLELLDDAATASGSSLRRSPAVAATGVGLSGTGAEESWPTRCPSLIQFVVMAAAHSRIVSEVRTALRAVKRRTADASVTPALVVKVSRRKQPYIYSCTLSVRNRSVPSGLLWVMDVTVRGTHLSLTTRLPPTLPGDAAYEAFGAKRPAHSMLTQQGRTAGAGSNNHLAETIQCASAAHFQQILLKALSWY